MTSNSDKENEKLSIKKDPNLIFLAIIFVFGILYVLWELLKGDRAYKSILARKYGVSTRTLLRWIEIFCPKEVQQLYIGTKLKTILYRNVYPYLGKPEERPQDGKSRPIITKADVCRAFDIESSTLRRRIKKINQKNEKETLGTTLEIYKSLKHLPPNISQKLVEFLEKADLNMKQYNP